MFSKISLMIRALTPTISAALDQHAGGDRCGSNGEVIEIIAASDEHRNDGGPGWKDSNRERADRPASGNRVLLRHLQPLFTFDIGGDIEPRH